MSGVFMWNNYQDCLFQRRPSVSWCILLVLLELPHPKSSQYVRKFDTWFIICDRNGIPSSSARVTRFIALWSGWKGWTMHKRCRWVDDHITGVPSGKRLHNYGKSQFFMGKSTISMAIFNSKLFNYQRVGDWDHNHLQLKINLWTASRFSRNAIKTTPFQHWSPNFSTKILACWWF